MLELRPSRPDHPDALRLIAEVQRWYVEIYGGEDTDPLPAEEFVPPSGGFVVGYDDGEPVAMGGWTRTAESDAKVRRMYVRPAARRRGYAGVLLTALEDDARAAGAARMVLTTGTPQVDAVRFYRDRGYTDIPPYGWWADGAQSVFLARSLVAGA